MTDRGVGSRVTACLFLFFALSGFCTLVYEVAWLRLAMAAFGVTTPMVSIVLSLFMAGLAVGSVLAGRVSRRWPARGTALRAYALAEGVIALSSVVVPFALRAGGETLGWLGTSWGSSVHYLLAGLLVAAGILPFCVCMGATLPLAMAAIRGRRSFSFLYLANLIGATLGTLGSAFVLIELLGFRGTLRVAGALNLALAGAAWWLGGRPAMRVASPSVPPVAAATGAPARLGLSWLFLTGLCSMAMEVVWTRLYLVFLGTVVYAFAGILAIYLASSYVGSQIYKLWARRRAGGDGSLWLWVAALLGAASLLPLLLSDPGHEPGGPKDFVAGLLRVAGGVAPFSAALGFLTPLLVDRHSGGSAERAGFAYAVNVVGCIVGPLAAAFLLLPYLGERTVLLLLALPLFGCALYTIARDRAWGALALCLVTVAPAAWLVRQTRSGNDRITAPMKVRRDYTATTVAYGSGRDMHLHINGEGMTSLTPITKMMAHLPLALHDGRPRQALVICFGMGTSYRSALAWDIPVTAVELVPSVPGLMGFFHPDGNAKLRDPNGRIVIDDGRRFLARDASSYDVIVIDPPPPIEAAGSSLLYSTEMYQAARRRLAPGGILQQWFPTDDAETLSAVSRALEASFPHVYVFHSIEGWGYHFLASAEPITFPPAMTVASRMPRKALRDLVEWGPERTPTAMLERVLGRPADLDALIARAAVPTLEDDRPVNEYYLLRRGHF